MKNMKKILFYLFCLVVSKGMGFDLSHTAVSNITTTSAYVSVEVGNLTDIAPDITLYYGRTDRTTNSSLWSFSTNIGVSTTGVHGIEIDNLIPANRYYFNWYGTDAYSTVWISTSSYFTTLSTPPTGIPPYSVHTVMVDADGNLISPTNFFDQAGIKTEDLEERIEVIESRTEVIESGTNDWATAFSWGDWGANFGLTSTTIYRGDWGNAVSGQADTALSTALGVGSGATGLVYAVGAALSNETIIGATITAGSEDSVVTNDRILEITWNSNAVESGVADLSGWSDYPASNMISHWISKSISTVTNVGYVRSGNYYGDDWHYYDSGEAGFMSFYRNTEPAQLTNITSGVFTVHPYPRDIPADNINITGISWPSVYDDWSGDFWSIWTVQASASDINFDQVSGYYVLNVWFNLGGTDSDVKKSVTNALDYEPHYISPFGGSNDTWGLDLSDVASSDLSNLTFYVEVEFFTDAPASDFLFDLSGWSSLDFTTPEYTRIWYQLDTLEEQKFGIDTNGVFKVEENGETKIPLYTTDIGNLYQPYQPYSSEYVITNNDTFYIDFYDGSLVKIMVSNETATIAFDNANYSWNGVNRVGVELWAGTNSIAFDTTTITNEVEFEIDEDGPTSLFFRRVEQEKWRGRQ